MARVAQLVERLTCNEDVAGSTPAGGLIFFGEVPKRSNGADCKSVGAAFGGSNPPLPTIDVVVIWVGLSALFTRELYAKSYLPPCLCIEFSYQNYLLLGCCADARRRAMQNGGGVAPRVHSF